MDTFWYVVNNASFARINKETFGTDVVGGITTVAAETMVAKMLQSTGMFGNKGHDGTFRTALVSATTIPIQGGFVNPVTAGKAVKANSTYYDAGLHGFSGIVPMLVAQYIVESSAGRFFHMPHAQVGDIAMMAIVKLITPLLMANLGFILENDGNPDRYLFGAQTRIAQSAVNANIPKMS